jgi:type IV pilus assembly protein PilV
MIRARFLGMSTLRQRGMTLIEILVAIVVLSVGLMGLAGLQLKGMQVNQGSTYRSQAAILAQEMAERIRADLTGAGNNTYTVTSGVPATPSAAMTDWLTRVQMLPGGTATITAPAAGGTPGTQLIDVTVNWVDTRAQTGAGLSSTSTAPGFGAPGSFDLPVEF